MTRTPADTARRHRRPDHDIDAIFYERWAPRAMSGEPITRAELDRVFEAARWAPSSYNRQPWRFFYALRDDPYWHDFLGLLTPGNRSWAQNGGALLIIASRKTLEDGTESRTHSFDTGAAWQNLALQGTSMGLVVHGMEGFDYEKAAKLSPSRPNSTSRRCASSVAMAQSKNCPRNTAHAKRRETAIRSTPSFNTARSTRNAQAKTKTLRSRDGMLTRLLRKRGASVPVCFRRNRTARSSHPSP